MTQITDAIGSIFNGFFASPVVQLSLKIAGIYVVFLWLACAYWAYRDLQTRTTNPVAPYLAAALIIAFTPIFFIFGVVLYRLVRPSETFAESNERALAEEAMLVEIEAQAHCANCGRSVHPDWIICPTCRNRLRRVCPSCGKLTELDWSLCAWCGKDFERPELLREVNVPARDRAPEAPQPAASSARPGRARRSAPELHGGSLAAGPGLGPLPAEGGSGGGTAPGGR
jgi:RNA polymerase subunit RPABC4/transcription elongation factor Spt4